MQSTNCGSGVYEEGVVWYGDHLGTIQSFRSAQGNTRWKIGDQEFDGECFTRGPGSNNYKIDGKPIKLNVVKSSTLVTNYSIKAGGNATVLGITGNVSPEILALMEQYHRR